MRPLISLLSLGVALFLLDYFLGAKIPTHESFHLDLIFFTVLGVVLLRIDSLTKEELRIQMNMVKIGIRLLTALVFVFYINFRFKESMNHALIQFIILYFVFMVFEIVMALSNLRRN
jgi:hypothetical protein